MKIIKDKQLSDNTWVFINNDENLKDGNISVTLQRWLNNQEHIQKLSGCKGIRLQPTDDVSLIQDYLDNLDLIEIDFPAFTDGRGFSQTRLLRERYNYQGEIRAIGKFMADQAFYMSRVGINAFQLEFDRELEIALSTLNDFSVTYQPSTH